MGRTSKYARVLSRTAVVLPACLSLVTCGSPEHRPNIVLVLVDQLRKDWADQWMPETMARAREGVVFEQMRSAAPWTYPSVISMFSGLYPQQHGADGAPDNGTKLSTFDEAVPLFPRDLRSAYYTAGFVTNPFLHTWNPLHTCFDHYEVDEFIGSQGPTRGNPELVWSEHMFSDSVNASVIAHFDARPAGGEPEFVYVHYIDVHGPWEGAPFDAGGALEKDTAPEARERAVRYVDRRITELHDYFDARYGGDLVFLVTSDHGMEMPGELELEARLETPHPQGFPVRQRKATVHDFNTRVPFLVLAGRHVPEARVVTQPCSNIDVCPTVLDFAGLATSASRPSRSLRPAIVSGDVAGLEHRPVYSLQSAFGRHNDCVVLEERKLFRHVLPGTGQVARFVYDLALDPAERAPIGNTFGADGALLVEAAGTHGLSFENDPVTLPEEELQHLRNLGYMGGEETRDE